MAVTQRYPVNKPNKSRLSSSRRIINYILVCNQYVCLIDEIFFLFNDIDEPKSIFSRLIHGFRRRDQNQSPPFVFNAQLLGGSSPQSHAPIQGARIMTDYGMIEPNGPFRASSRSHPHTMRRASLRTHSTDTRQAQAQAPVPILPAPSSTNQIRRPRPRSFSFDEQLSIIDDDDESIVHDMPFTVAPVRPSQTQQQSQAAAVVAAAIQHRRLNTSKVSSRCRTRRRRSRSLTKRSNLRPVHGQHHEWLHTTENHPETSSSEEYDDEEDEQNDQDDDPDNEPHFSPRSTSTAANRPRNRKPLLHASDFDRRLCDATINNNNNNEAKTSASPTHTDPIPHHTSPVSQPSTVHDEINLIVYSTNTNDFLNATISSRKSETNASLKKFTVHEKLVPLRYGSPDSGISGKT